MIKLLSSLIGSRLIFFPLLMIPAWHLWNEKVQGRLGQWKVEEIQDYLGNTAIILLITVLCYTPLKVLFPHARLVAALNKHRRATGIACALYATWHVYYYIRDAEGYDAIVDEFSRFIYLQFGLVTLLLLWVLFLTSNNLSVWILRYPFWKLIHRLAYVAAFFAFLHRGFGAQKDTLTSTIYMFAPLVILEILRILKQIYNKITGTIHHFRVAPAFAGWREFRVARKVPESSDIVSLYLEPVDGRRLKSFKPGQYLTYEFLVPGREEPVIRCYSLSDAPSSDHYRASVKRVPTPREHPEFLPGISSNYIHDQLQAGSIIRIQAPAGGFFLDPRGRNPVVLIGAGIGLTPVLSMLKTLAAHRSKREVWFIYGTRSKADDPLRGEVEAAIKELPNGRLAVVHSQPAADEIKGTDYHESGRLNLEMLKRILPGNRFDFYFCGPGPMIEALAEALTAWGVPVRKMHVEAFGPSALRAADLPKGVAASAKIVLKRTKKTLQWDGSQSSILTLAESQGVKLKFGCRAGNCGTCKVRLIKGEVTYANPPAADPGSKGALTCVGLPMCDLELDA